MKTKGRFHPHSFLPQVPHMPVCLDGLCHPILSQYVSWCAHLETLSIVPTYTPFVEAVDVWVNFYKQVTLLTHQLQEFAVHFPCNDLRHVRTMTTAC